MKKALLFITAAGCSLLYSPIFSQEKALSDSLGLPGDNLNLYGVLDIFQQCKTLEEFETKLNSSDSKVNNIDLNGDNKIDYIKVVDNMHGTAHAIVLQDVINEKETQDLAVIEVDKDNNGKAHIQIIGDEQLYGKNYIIEPKGEDAGNTASGGTPNPGYNLRRSNTYISPDGKTTYVNNYYTSDNRNVSVYDDGYYADSWPLISYLYLPTYVTYVSPWYWGYYPSFWFAWTPLFWHSYYYGYYYPHYNHYCGYYHRAYSCRNSYAHNYYGQRRSSSAFVNQRREQGGYRSTYSRPDLASRQTNTNRFSGRSAAIGNARSNSEARQSSNERNNRTVNNNVSRSERNSNTANARSNSDARQTSNERNNWAGNNNVNRAERNSNTSNARSNSDARQTANGRNNWAGNNSINRSSGSDRSYYSNSSSRSGAGFASHGSPSASHSAPRSSGGSGFASRSSSGGFSSHSSGGFSSQGGGGGSRSGGGGGGGSRSGGGGGGNRGGGGGRR